MPRDNTRMGAVALLLALLAIVGVIFTVLTEDPAPDDSPNVPSASGQPAPAHATSTPTATARPDA